MYFETIDALIAMDGHGPYVWSAYAIALVVLSGLIIAPLRKKRQLLVELRMQLRRQQGNPSAAVNGDSRAPRS